MHTIIYVILTFLVLSRIASAEPNETFFVKIWHEDKNGIWVSIETNLPDHVEIRLSLSRAIITIRDEKIVGDEGIIVERKPKKTWFSYFSIREPVSQWRKRRLIAINDEEWRQRLQKHRNKMSAIGTPFKINEITDEIELSAYAYKNKTGEPYDKREYKSQMEKVFGKSISKKSTIKVSRPWPDLNGLPKEPSIVNAYYLEVDKVYRLIKERTPITKIRRSRSLKELDRMFKSMRYLPAGTLIRVLEVVGHKEDRPYYPAPHYRVSLPEHSGVEGWIYSTALSPDGVWLVVEERVQPPQRKSTQPGQEARSSNKKDCEKNHKLLTETHSDGTPVQATFCVELA